MRNYRDLIVWQRAHKLTLQLYEVTARFPKTETYCLISQIRRAAASIGANLAEGCGRWTDGELVHTHRDGISQRTGLSPLPCCRTEVCIGTRVPIHPERAHCSQENAHLVEGADKSQKLKAKSP